MMSRWMQFLGIVGFVMLVYAILGYFLIGAVASALLNLHFGVGILLLLASLLFRFFSETRPDKESAAQKSHLVRTRSLSKDALLFLALFLILTVCNVVLKKVHWRADFTSQRVYSLSEETKQLIAALETPIEIVAVRQPQLDEDAFDMLRLIKSERSDFIQITKIDPLAQPHLVESYGFKRGEVLYVGAEHKRSKGVRSSEISEQEVANALFRLSTAKIHKVYFIEGFKSPRIEDATPFGLKLFADSLQSFNFEVESLLLPRVGSLPVDADALFLINPRNAIPEKFSSLLKNYVEGGGRLFISTDPPGNVNVRTLLQSFGIRVEPNIIIEKMREDGKPTRLVAQTVTSGFGYHPITKGIAGETLSVFNISSSLSITGKNSDTTTYTPLVTSGSDSWGESNVKQLFDKNSPSAEKGADELVGPLNIGVSFENESSRLVAFGDTDWMLNANLKWYGNKDLALNTAQWLTSNEQAIALRPRSFHTALFRIPRDTFVQILITSFLLPELIVLFGLFVWWRRRVRRTLAA